MLSSNKQVKEKLAVVVDLNLEETWGKALIASVGSIYGQGRRTLKTNLKVFELYPDSQWSSNIFVHVPFSIWNLYS